MTRTGHRTRRGAGPAIGLAIAGLLLAGCSSDDEASGKDAEPEDAPSSTAPAGPVDYGSVSDLRDAAVDAGFECKNWKQTNAVTLAAESGSCDAGSVLTTYASDADLQAQLDQEKANSELLNEAGITSDPILVGPNWLLKTPKAPELREELGGVLIGAKS